SRKTTKRNTSSGRIRPWALRRLMRSARASFCLSVRPEGSERETLVAIAGSRDTGTKRPRPRRARVRRDTEAPLQPTPLHQEGALHGNLLGGPGVEALFQLLAVVGPEGHVHGHLVGDVFRGGRHVLQARRVEQLD